MKNTDFQNKLIDNFKNHLKKYKGNALLDEFLNDSEILEAIENNNSNIILNALRLSQAFIEDFKSNKEAMIYLSKVDPTLQKSMSLAHTLWGDVDNLDSCDLATYLIQDQNEELYNDLKCDEYINDLQIIIKNYENT